MKNQKTKGKIIAFEMENKEGQRFTAFKRCSNEGMMFTEANGQRTLPEYFILWDETKRGFTFRFHPIQNNPVNIFYSRAMIIPVYEEENEYIAKNESTKKTK